MRCEARSSRKKIEEEHRHQLHKVRYLLIFSLHTPVDSWPVICVTISVSQCGSILAFKLELVTST